MKIITRDLLVSALSISTATAFVIVDGGSSSSNIQRRQTAPTGPAAQLLQIVPGAKDCNSADPAFKTECITAQDAVQPIINGFSKYSITTAPEQAALLAWIALESGELKFNVHHFPSENPGQGTRNMMSPSFVLEYATELGVAPAGTTPAAALETLNKDVEMSFGSAAWFYSRKCTDSVKGAVRSGSQAGFELFTTSCVSTTMTPERLAYWKSAAAALGVPQ